MANNMVNINFRAKKVVKENGIPFDVTADLFYSESNMKHLEYMNNKIKNGQAHFSEHELIEVDD